MPKIISLAGCRQRQHQDRNLGTPKSPGIRYSGIYLAGISKGFVNSGVGIWRYGALKIASGGFSERQARQTQRQQQLHRL